MEVNYIKIAAVVGSLSKDSLILKSKDLFKSGTSMISKLFWICKRFFSTPNYCFLCIKQGVLVSSIR